MKKLKIIVNAYACAPNLGSEHGMSWNWCLHLAKYNELFIITEQEYEESINSFLENYHSKNNLHFYYISVTPKVRKMCKNQGDWRFYFFYKEWQKKVLNKAKEITKEYDIDILHQLNMIGFREPGYLWKIKDIPFVWGPIGGLHQFPIKYLKSADIKLKIFFNLKRVLNIIQIKYSGRVNKALNKASLLISATPDSYKAIKKYKNLESIHIPDQGTFHNSVSNLNNKIKISNNKHLNIIWVGKFDFGKQLHIAIESIAKTGNKYLNLNIYGTGSHSQIAKYKNLVSKLDLNEQVFFHGFKPIHIINKAMRESDLFFFTSVSEGTPTVIMEAISNSLPVLCFDACGFGAIVDDSIGIKIQFSNPKTSINEFAEHLNTLYNDRKKLSLFSNNCQFIQERFLWDRHAEKLNGLYHDII